MKNVPVVLFTMVTSLVCAGCATVRTADDAHRGSPKIYGGTRLNVAALTSNADALASYKHYGVEAPEYPGFDLPSYLPSLRYGKSVAELWR